MRANERQCYSHEDSRPPSVLLHQSSSQIWLVDFVQAEVCPCSGNEGFKFFNNSLIDPVFSHHSHLLPKSHTYTGINANSDLALWKSSLKCKLSKVLSISCIIMVKAGTNTFNLDLIQDIKIFLSCSRSFWWHRTGYWLILFKWYVQELRHRSFSLFLFYWKQARSWTSLLFTMLSIHPALLQICPTSHQLRWARSFDDYSESYVIPPRKYPVIFPRTMG